MNDEVPRANHAAFAQRSASVSARRRIARTIAVMGALASFTGCGEPEITAEPDAPVKVVTPTASGGKGDVFGTDDRVEPFTLEDDSPVRIATRATAAMIHSDRLARAGGLVELVGAFETLAEGDEMLCEDYSFSNQPSVATCTGFLVAPDILVTAGHCVASVISDCTEESWVFGFEYEDEAAALAGRMPKFGPDDVYGCKEILSWANIDCSADYAVVQLDRPVVGREPLRVNPERPSLETGVYSIGFPSGIPMKVSPGAVTDLSYYTTAESFETTVDGFGGNSGGPVVGADGDVHGILVCGNTYVEYVWDDEKSCTIPNVCDEDKRCRGIGNYGIDNVAPFLDCLASGETSEACSSRLPTYPVCDPVQADCPDGRSCQFSRRSEDFRCLATSEHLSELGQDCFTDQCGGGEVCRQQDDSTSRAPNYLCGQVCESSADCDRGECDPTRQWRWGGYRFCTEP